MDEVKKMQSKLNRARKAIKNNKKKYSDLVKEITKMKKEIISELETLEIKIKKIMNTGDLR